MEESGTDLCKILEVPIKEKIVNDFIKKHNISKMDKTTPEKEEIDFTQIQHQQQLKKKKHIYSKLNAPATTNQWGM